MLGVHILTLGYLKEEPKSFDEIGDDVRTFLDMKKEDVFRCSPLSPALIFYTNELKLLFTSIKRNIYLEQLERECAENQKFSAWRPLYGSGSSGTHFPGFTDLCAAFNLQEQQR